jgi:transcriptional regulator with XRE-family HTH domain
VELYQYLWENKVTQIDFAKKIKISLPSLSTLTRKHRSPSLITALNIVKASKGKVKLDDLISEKDKKKLL